MGGAFLFVFARIFATARVGRGVPRDFHFSGGGEQDSTCESSESVLLPALYSNPHPRTRTRTCRKPAATGMDSVGSPGKGVRQSKPRKGASKREILMESTMLKWAPVFSDIEKRREDVKSIRSFMEALGTLQSSYASGLKRLSEYVN